MSFISFLIPIAPNCVCVFYVRISATRAGLRLFAHNCVQNENFAENRTGGRSSETIPLKMCCACHAQISTRDKRKNIVVFSCVYYMAMQCTHTKHFILIACIYDIQFILY